MVHGTELPVEKPCLFSLVQAKTKTLRVQHTPDSVHRLSKPVLDVVDAMRTRDGHEGKLAGSKLPSVLSVVLAMEKCATRHAL